MGGSDADTPEKAPKTPTQEQPPTPSSSSAATVYPDWSGFQAYSPIPPHGFFHPSVASSPQPHPYMWGAQPLMPPYGTPPPPYVMYPPGGLYSHPSIPGSHPYSPYAMPSPNVNVEASGAMHGGMEVDGKLSEGKERSSLKSSKGSLGSLNMITGKNSNELGKTSGASANEVFSQSGESGSEGSSEGSDANSQNDSQPKTGGGQDSFDEASQNGTSARGSVNGVAHTSSHAILNQTMPIMPMPAAGPTTNLNIGMDYWGTPTPSSITSLHGKVPTVGAMVPGSLGSRENFPSELWLQDERELKRQKRKQSNRESARRSRLRKQAECEELSQRVEVLKDESTALRAELNRITKEHEQLLSENTSLKERLGEIQRGTEDSRLDRDDQHYDDGDHQRQDSDAQAGPTNLVQNGR